MWSYSSSIKRQLCIETVYFCNTSPGLRICTDWSVLSAVFASGNLWPLHPPRGRRSTLQSVERGPETTNWTDTTERCLTASVRWLFLTPCVLLVLMFFGQTYVDLAGNNRVWYLIYWIRLKIINCTVNVRQLNVFLFQMLFLTGFVKSNSMTLSSQRRILQCKLKKSLLRLTTPWHSKKMNSCLSPHSASWHSSSRLIVREGCWIIQWDICYRSERETHAAFSSAAKWESTQRKKDGFVLLTFYN